MRGHTRESPQSLGSDRPRRACPLDPLPVRFAYAQRHRRPNYMKQRQKAHMALDLHHELAWRSRKQLPTSYCVANGIYCGN